MTKDRNNLSMWIMFTIVGGMLTLMFIFVICAFSVLVAGVAKGHIVLPNQNVYTDTGNFPVTEPSWWFGLSWEATRIMCTTIAYVAILLLMFGSIGLTFAGLKSSMRILGISFKREAKPKEKQW